MQRIAAHLDDAYSIETRVQKIERFFAEQEFDYNVIALIIMEILGLVGKGLHLVLDRTNWKFGKTHINFLVLAVRIEGFGAVPLLWVNLGKAGNSNTRERIDLLERLFHLFPDATIASLTGDREFIGDNWMSYLLQHNVTFYIRIKENRLVEHDGKMVHTRDFFTHLSPSCSPKKLKLEFNDFGTVYNLYYVGVRSKAGDLVIIMTNADIKPREVMNIYKSRWDIECLFGNVKQKGFNLEDTHMTIPERLEKLMAMCAIATALCVKTGATKNSYKPIKYRKSVGSSLYSFFQYGLNHIRSNFYKIINTIMENIVTKLTNNSVFMAIEKTFAPYQKSEG